MNLLRRRLLCWILNPCSSHSVCFCEGVHAVVLHTSNICMAVCLLAFSFYLIFDLTALELASLWNWRRRDCCVRQDLLLSYIKNPSNSWLLLSAQVSICLFLLDSGCTWCKDHHIGHHWMDGLGRWWGQLAQQGALFLQQQRNLPFTFVWLHL